MTCPSCGHAVPGSASFCAACGARLMDSDAPTLAATGHSAARSVTMSGVSASFDGRFPPGALLAERYRIAGLLGRGGMGEVYRADDLVLGQPVALKFLPDAVAADTDRLARFRAEVRVAREVSHPNVCRVYDIGEIDGHPFLTMEYIDGENLSSLLRRIGRLPHDTAVDMARQLCAGLAAAHDKGVLHRDIKPANVMIDGRGKVKIADFGLAAVTGDATNEALAGTPAYMAPELFDRKSPSVRSDIYALGLVLYEMFAGKPAFQSTTVGEMARLQHESTPTSLSKVLTDIDPVVERVIHRCLSKDPDERPASALLVAAALPGGDPLAAALAAGETPSPEMVAAAGGVGALRPGVALACLASVLAGCVIVVWLSARTQAIRYAPSEKPPAVLVDQAASIISRLGYTERPGDTAHGFTRTDYIAYLREHDVSVTRWDNLRSGQPPGFTFWYRQSPQTLTTDRFALSGSVTLQDPPLRSPGMVAVMLDLRGRLHQLMAVAPRLDASTDRKPADWSLVFREAGFDPARFTASAPRWTPPVYADTRAAWDGVYPDRPDVTIHVEAASAGGLPVFFQVFEPWSTQTLLTRATGGVPAAAIVGLTVQMGILIGAFLLVRRNIRLGRGDRDGAFRLGLVVCLVRLAGSLLSADLRPDLLAMAPVLTMLVAQGLLMGALAWIFYLALEPDLRRRSPHMLIAWTRVLAGRFTDPLVGRDILIGILAGVGMQLLTQLGYLSPVWFGQAPDVSLPIDGGEVADLRHLFSVLLRVPVIGVLVSTGFVLLVFLLTLVFRRQWLVIAVFCSMLAAGDVAGDGLNISLAFSLLYIAILMFVMLRVGLLSLIVATLTNVLLDHVPMTFDPGVWYSGFSWIVLTLLTAVALYGFRVALAGRPLFEGVFDSPSP